LEEKIDNHPEIKRIVSDVEISRCIYMQLCDLMPCVQLEEERKSELFTTVIEVMKKLEALKYHKVNCVRIISEELGRRNNSKEHDNRAVQIDLTSGAEKEAEAFLMQGKSCLDVLAKIFRPLFNIKLNTYGKSGDQLIQSLQNNLDTEELARSKALIQIIRVDKEWINKWLKSERDTVSHYKALESSGFRNLSSSGTPFFEAPATKEGYPLDELLENLYHNLLTFCEDFIARAVSVRFHPAVMLGIIPKPERAPQFPRKYGVFIIRDKKRETGSEVVRFDPFFCSSHEGKWTLLQACNGR
jgi:hypothetical protein